MSVEDIEMNDIRVRNRVRKDKYGETQETVDIDTLLFFSDWAMDSIRVLTKTAIAIQGAEAKSKAHLEEKLKNAGSQ